MIQHKTLRVKLMFLAIFTALFVSGVMSDPALLMQGDDSVISLKSDSIPHDETAIKMAGDYQAGGSTYYVSVNGSDGNPGTEALPFRTMTHGVSVLEPGDTLYIREGTFYEQVTVRISGSPGNPITISAYPGEYPVIDGQNTLPGEYESYIFLLWGDHLILSGLEIKNVYGSGVLVHGNYNIVRNMKIHHCINKGILVSSGGYCTNSSDDRNKYNIIEDNEIWMTSLIHEGVTDGGKTVGALTVARCPEYTIVRRNVVHETWGSGIQTHEAFNTTVEDNIVWNNQTTHYYVNNAPYTLLQRNISYNTPGTIFLYQGRPGTSFGLADERPEPLSHHITVINNLTLGGDRGFYFWLQQDGSGLKDVLVANNTFVDSFTTGITIREGAHENVRIINNIIVDDESLAYVPDPTPLVFSHNLWSDVPRPAVTSHTDVIGDPYLSKSGSTDPGLLDPGWFDLLPDSPAIDSGMTLSEVTDDFSGDSRPRGIKQDIGAYESPFSNYIHDLHIVDVVINGQNVAVSFQWTAPVNAVDYRLRSSPTLIKPSNWHLADDVPVPFTPSVAGSTENLTTNLVYTGDTFFYALQFQNTNGVWSELSNVVFWPTKNIYLPLVNKNYDISRSTNSFKLFANQPNCFSWALLMNLSGYVVLKPAPVSETKICLVEKLNDNTP